MKMELDTEDRVDRFKMAFQAVRSLIDGSEMHQRIDPHPLGVLLDLLGEELERALPTGGGRPPRAVNDLDTA